MPHPTSDKYLVRLFVDGEFFEYRVPCLKDVTAELHPMLGLTRGQKDHLCHYWNSDDEQYHCKAGRKGKMKYHYLHLRKLQPELVQTDTQVPACT